MTLIWDKIGRVYAPDGKEWMSSHASNTVPIHRGRGISSLLRSRDLREGHISFVDIDVGSGEFDVVAEASTPVLSPGLPGFVMKAG